MKKIITFPNTGRDPVQQAQGDGLDFLGDGDELLSFDGADRSYLKHTSSKAPQKTAYSDATWTFRDWDNQEAASIWRVKHLLDAVGIQSSLEYGLSDEGDPWCVFCTQHGEVVIHLCRINQAYMLDSPNLSAPLWGNSFEDLIEAFSADARGRNRDAPALNGKVIKLERGGSVSLHPATMLAALLWSVFLGEEDLVLLDYNNGRDAAQDPNNAIAAINDFNLGLYDSTGKSRLEGETTQAEATGSKAIDDSMSAALRDMGGKYAVTLSAGTIAVGLSSLSLAAGFLSDAFSRFHLETSDVLASDAQSPNPNGLKGSVDEQSFELTFNQTTQNNRTFSDLGKGVPGPETAAHLAENPGLPVTEDKAAFDVKALLDNLLDPAGPAMASVEVDLDSMGQFFPGDPYDPFLLPPLAPNGAHHAAPSKDIESVDMLKDSAVAFLDPAPLPDLHSMFADEIRNVKVAEISVKSSMDITDLPEERAEIVSEAFAIAITPSDPLADSDVEDEPMEVVLAPSASEDVQEPAIVHSDSAPQSSAPQSEYPIFDAKARSYLDYLLDEEHVEYISYGQTVILIDFDVERSAVEEMHTMRWQLSDGGIVSIIGFKDDYEAFDLIV